MGTRVEAKISILSVGKEHKGVSNEGEGSMGGGLGRTEMDEVLLLRVPSQSLQKRIGRGKESAVESVVEMCDGGERNRKKCMVCVFFSFFFLAHFSSSFYPLFAMVAHLFAFRTAKRVEIANR